MCAVKLLETHLHHTQIQSPAHKLRHTGKNLAVSQYLYLALQRVCPQRTSRLVFKSQTKRDISSNPDRMHLVLPRQRRTWDSPWGADKPQSPGSANCRVPGLAAGDGFQSGLRPRVQAHATPAICQACSQLRGVSASLRDGDRGQQLLRTNCFRKRERQLLTTLFQEP